MLPINKPPAKHTTFVFIKTLENVRPLLELKEKSRKCHRRLSHLPLLEDKDIMRFGRAYLNKFPMCVLILLKHTIIM